MSRPASSSSIRVGAQVYQISLTPAQLEQRHVDKQRERRISRETSKRRKALEERRKQSQLREERERQNELMKRRERQREATERYQRAHIPHQARRRFGSPVLRSPIYPASFRRATDPLDATLKEIRKKGGFQEKRDFSSPKQLRGTSPVIVVPQPPTYPKPKVNAWNETGRLSDPPEELPRAPSRCDKRVEVEEEEPKTTSEEDELETTFTVAQTAPINRASTPETLVPAPPTRPRPTPPTQEDPRVRTIQVLNVHSAPALITEEKKQIEEVIEKPDKGDIAPEPEKKGILKANSSTRRRVVSATKNHGLVAASIRDSLDLVGRKLDKPSKSVKWDKLYYDDSTVAEFGGDGKPVFVKETTKKRGRKATTAKQQAKAEKGAGKRATKTAKAENTETTRQMTSYTSQAIIIPHPSSGGLRTEAPIIKPSFDYTESTRIPMPPTVARPLTSRTQIIRSKRFKPTPKGPVKVQAYNKQQAEGQMVVNSNNQVNIHIGSVEINENLQKTPTDQEINWLWERVRSALEEQHTQPVIRPKSAPKSSRGTPVFSKSTRPSSATVNGSTNQFLLAEKMARHGATDEHIMNVIDEVPVTQLSFEEQQIQESLIRLDNRLNNIQGAKSRRYQKNGAFQR